MATFDDDNVGTSAGGTTPTYGQQKRSAQVQAFFS